MIHLTCPACGANLELAQSTGVALCSYCGTKIMLQQGENNPAQAKLMALEELCSGAMMAGNHKDALEYSNRVLETDAKNINAWTFKAISVYQIGLAAGADRFKEAMGYFKKALSLSPGCNEVIEARSKIIASEVARLVNLGMGANREGVRLYKFFVRQQNTNPYAMKMAIDNSGPHFTKAMDFFLHAAQIDPDNLVIYSHIAGLVRETQGKVNWGKEVFDTLNLYRALSAKDRAKKILPKLRADYARLMNEYYALEKQSGGQASSKLAKMALQLKKLYAQINQEEKYSSITPPKPDY